MRASVERLRGDLTSVKVTDRLAKIATAYSGGGVSIVYGAAAASHTAGDVIVLPAACRFVALMLPGGCPEFEATTWAYVNHEMGHLDVERRLRRNREHAGLTRVTESLVELVPEGLLSCAVFNGAEIKTPSEINTEVALLSPGTPGRVIAEAYTGTPEIAARQFLALWNVAEDARQEAVTSSRWPGAERHMAFAWGKTRETWEADAEEAGREDGGMFVLFLQGLACALRGEAHEWMGQKPTTHLRSVEDLIEEFKAANWADEHGVYDSVNFALAVLGRLYRREEPEAPPTDCTEFCPSSMADDLSLTPCETRDDEDTQEDGDEAEEGESPQPEPEGASPAEGEERELEDGEDTADGEAEDEAAEGGEGEDAEAPEDHEDEGEIEIGSVVRVSGMSARFKVMRINEDGSVEADRLTDEEADAIIRREP